MAFDLPIFSFFSRLTVYLDRNTDCSIPYLIERFEGNNASISCPLAYIYGHNITFNDRIFKSTALSAPSREVICFQISASW